MLGLFSAVSRYSTLSFCYFMLYHIVFLIFYLKIGALGIQGPNWAQRSLFWVILGLLGYLKGPKDSHKIIIKILNETSVSYCVKFYPTIISQNKQMMLSQRPSWFLIPDPIIAQWAPPDDWGVESQHPQSVATMNGQSWSAEALHSTEYISYLPCLMTWPLMPSLFIPTATARAREVVYYVLLLLVIVKLEDIIINWKTALKMVIVKTQ